MPTSKRQPTLAEHQLSLIWGGWAELGVSGWQRTHGDWAIDPEPLIIATAALEDEDPRLRDEALDWCISQWRYVSRVQLKNLLREHPDDVREAWGPFAATVSDHAGVSWPGATEGFDYQTTGKTMLDSMERPSRAWLRLRGMFGLGARTEILRFFLSGHRRATVATIAEHARYAKRVVADECDTLQKAGVLQSQQVANRFYYRLNRSSALAEFVGEIAPIRPNWPTLFRVTSALVALERSAERLSNGALMVEAHRVAKSLEEDLDALGIEDPPSLTDPNDHWPAVRDFAEQYLGAWARGEWDSDDEEVVDLTPRRTNRGPATSAGRR
jgi:hypothetical protein